MAAPNNENRNFNGKKVHKSRYDSNRYNKQDREQLAKSNRLNNANVSTSSVHAEEAREFKPKRKNRNFNPAYNRNRLRMHGEQAGTESPLKVVPETNQEQTIATTNFKEHNAREKLPNSGALHRERNFRAHRNNSLHGFETAKDIQQDIARLEKEIKLAMAELKSYDVSI